MKLCKLHFKTFVLKIRKSNLKIYFCLSQDIEDFSGTYKAPLYYSMAAQDSIILNEYCNKMEVQEEI